MLERIRSPTPQEAAMPCVACDRCNRFYVIDREESEQRRCPNCSRQMRLAAVEEGLKRILPDRDPLPAARGGGYSLPRGACR